MNKRRWLLSLLLIVVIVSMMIGSFIAYRRMQPNEPPLTIEVLEHPRHVTSPTVNLRGHVSQQARIEATRDNASLGSVFSNDKDFEIEVQLEAGDNRIRLSARTDEPSSLRAETQTFIRWEPKNPPVPVINPLPPKTNLRFITITGTTYPDGHVTLTVSPDVPVESKKLHSPTEQQKRRMPSKSEMAKSASADAQPPEPHTEELYGVDKYGAFQKKWWLPQPGSYRITAVAVNSTGETSAPSSDVKFVYDPDWYPTRSPVASPTPKPILRRAKIVLAHKQMIVTLEATLPRDDPAVASLLASQTSLDDFFEEIFSLEINGIHYTASDFKDIVPQIVIKEYDATITATTAPHRTVRDFLPLLRGELAIAGKGDFPFSKTEDSLSIQTNDYTVESISPPPTLLEQSSATWIGSDTHSFSGTEVINSGPSSQRVKLQLSYRPFASPRNLFHLAQLSPHYLWKYPGGAIATLLWGLCSLIPMLWVFWLIGESPVKGEVDENLQKDLFRLLKTFTTLSLIVTVSDVSWGMAYLGYELKVIHNINSSSHPTLLALATVAVFFISLLCRLLTLAAPGHTWSIWLARISNGSRNAAVICLLLVPVSLLDINQFAARAASFAVIGLTLALFFFRFANVLKHGSPTPKCRLRLRWLAVFISLAFLIPVILPGGKYAAQTTISDSFSVLRDFLPYAVAVGLLIILRKVGVSDRRQARLLALCAGLILFSAYLVGSTPNLFMIPIPFILSIWVFRNFLIHNSRNRWDLDLVNKEVVSERRRLIDDVLANETAQQFQADVQKLKEKVSSGDMTVSDFEDRKVEIESYAQDKELASTHTNGLRVKTTVLSIGPSTDDWTNGIWCVNWGAILIAPFLIAYMLLLLLGNRTVSESARAFLFSLDQILTFVADWLIAAFFFGYYFRYIRGNSGLEKGLRTACAVIICLLPTWFTHISRKTDLIEVFFRAGQTFLFFTILGMGAFDYKTFRGALREQFRWKTFARFGDMPSFTAVVSVLVTSVGVGLTTVLTGQFSEILKKLLSAAFYQAPSGPP